MNSNTLKLFLLIFTFGIATSFAADENINVQVGELEEQTSTTFSPKKLWLFFGGDMGYTGHSQRNGTSGKISSRS